VRRADAAERRSPAPGAPRKALSYRRENRIARIWNLSTAKYLILLKFSAEIEIAVSNVSQ
jgi:hypothetical protein